MNGDLSSLAVFLPMIIIMYFLMIRPQMKRQKEQRAMMEALAKNDEVITIGGMLGKVTKVTEVYVVLEIAANTEVVVQKIAISNLLPKGTIKSV